MRRPTSRLSVSTLFLLVALAGAFLLSRGVSLAGESAAGGTSPSLAAVSADGLVLLGPDSPTTGSPAPDTTDLAENDAQATDAPAAQTTEPDDAATSAALELLDRIEARHGRMKTLKAEFDQILVTETFGEEIASRGELYIELPDRLRCDYLDPDAATLLFVGDTMYVHVPKNEMVDKHTYRTESEAREKFRLAMLGFGVSSEETLKSYRVGMARDAGDEWTSGTALQVLAFAPRDADLAKTFREIRVGIDPETLLPRRVRLEEAVGEVRTLTIRRIVLDDPISAEKFEPDFPGNPEIVEH